MTRPAETLTFKAPKPSYDRNALYYPHDSGGDFVYEPREPFTKKDVVMPGHFNAYRDDLRVGTRICCRLGDIADGILEVELQIIERPRQEGDGDILVSFQDHKTGKFCPVRHDGTLAEVPGT